MNKARKVSARRNVIKITIAKESKMKLLLLSLNLKSSIVKSRLSCRGRKISHDDLMETAMDKTSGKNRSASFLIKNFKLSNLLLSVVAIILV